MYLLTRSESRVITITALLTKCLRMVSAPKTIEGEEIVVALTLLGGKNDCSR